MAILVLLFYDKVMNPKNAYLTRKTPIIDKISRKVKVKLDFE